MAWEYFDVTFDLGPLHQGQVRITKLKNAYNLLIIGHGLGTSDVFSFDLGGPSFPSQI